MPIKKLSLILLFLCYNYISALSGVLNDTLKVKVIDTNKSLVQGVKVFVAENPPVITNEHGEYLLISNKENKFPFKVSIEKEGYELFEFTYLDDDNELEIIVKPSIGKDLKDNLLAKEESKTSKTNSIEKGTTEIIKSGKETTFDDKGSITKKGNKDDKKISKDSKESIVKVGEKVAKKEKSLLSKDSVTSGKFDAIRAASSTKQNDLSVIQKDKLILDQQIEEAVIAAMIKADLYMPDTSSVNVSLSKSEKTFNNYKGEFTEISKEIFSEKIRLEMTSEKIKQEIERITEKLLKEKNLDQDQKKSLENYLSKLEAALKENTLAYEKAQERTSFMIQNLRAMLVAKDSMYILANQKLKLAEKEKDKVERKLNRNLVSFTIVIFFLLFLAMVFFTIANRMKKQRHDLLQTKEALSFNLRQLNKKNELMEEQNKHFDNFIYNISKDENGPIKSILKLADTEKKASKGIDNPFDIIIKNLTRFNSFVIGFLSINKAYKTEVALSVINLEKIIKESYEGLLNIPGSENVNLEVDIEKDLYFESDERLLKSIVVNIIENSIKYQDPSKNGLVKITARDKDDIVEIKVKDNGLGIDPTQLSKIFHLFYQIDSNSNGNGLGLSLVKTHIEKLDGKIMIKSQPGEGTTITISLPMSSIMEKEA